MVDIYTRESVAIEAGQSLVYTGSLLFGISIVYIGIGLGFALLVGTMTAVGVLTPRLLLYHSLFASTGDVFVWGGVLLSALSVVFGFYSSKGKEPTGGHRRSSTSGNSAGSLLAIMAGILSGLLPAGVAMPWSHRLQQSAVSFGGASSSSAMNAVLALVLAGGALPNCGYYLYLLSTKKTYLDYQRYNHFRCWIAVFSMAFLYSASLALWGFAISPALLGVLGPSVGWALFVSMIVLASTSAGLISGEWKYATKSSVGHLSLSIALLISSMVLICYGNYLG